ncbi:quaternary ammonium compound-resistance protein SugE [Andreprevotia lacus DSM 23236]|uniref:Guanidinium exporter n=1 Tax=Andreprevotia lacus DSM 23236 TaxID=1121001 RepID=A0A1W1XYU7_9NEIS|nr:multidrug efflux SMR transporter [Andreprevotia lacus]SMC29045.1 quaternary ammonium compound-resistance protein SugE [Andreprevotia lacus DSM 23236]
MASHWLILALAVVTEIIWALSLKYVQLHPSPWVVAGSIALSFVNMALLSFAMRGIPAGTAYAIWTGLGAIGVTIGSIIWFGDGMSAARLFFLALIVGGVVGLKAVS